MKAGDRVKLLFQKHETDDAQWIASVCADKLLTAVRSAQRGQDGDRQVTTASSSNYSADHAAAVIW